MRRGVIYGAVAALVALLVLRVGTGVWIKFQDRKDPEPLPGRVQVGDLVLQIPPEVRYTITPDDRHFYAPHDSRARSADSVGLLQKSVIAIAGLQTREAAWHQVPLPNVPSSQVVLRIFAHSGRPVTFLVPSPPPGTGPGSFFGLPVIDPDRTLTEWLSSNDLATSYSLSPQITPSVGVFLRLGDNDLKDTTRSRITRRIEDAIKAWIVPAPFSTPVVR